MDVILKQSGDKVGVYINKQLATILEGKTIEQAVDWIENNLQGVKIHIAN